MSVGEIFHAFRKLALLLASASPRLARLAAAAAARCTALACHPRLLAAWKRVRGSAVGEHAARLAYQFWWPQLSGGRVDLASVPAESRAVLRAGLATSAALCLLLPLAVSVGPLIQVSTASAAKGPVAAWAVPLWGVALAVGWGALLAGAGASNRAAALVAEGAALWSLAVAAGAFGRSAWSACAPAVALLAYALSERRLRRPGPRDAAAGLAAGLALGAAAGVALVGFTPLARAAHGHVLAAGLGCGVLLGLAAFAWSRRAGRVPSVTVAASLLSGLALLHLAALGGRAGLSAVLPLRGGDLLVLDLVAAASEWPARRWDVVRAAEAARAGQHARERGALADER